MTVLDLSTGDLAQIAQPLPNLGGERITLRIMRNKVVPMFLPLTFLDDNELLTTIFIVHRQIQTFEQLTRTGVAETNEINRFRLQALDIMLEALAHEIDYRENVRRREEAALESDGQPILVQ